MRRRETVRGPRPMTKPLTYLLLLFGGAITAGAGVLTYSEWRNAGLPIIAVAPDEPGDSRSAPSDAVPSAPAAPQSAPSGAGAPAARSAPEEKIATVAPPAAEERFATPQSEPSAPEASTPAAPPDKLTALQPPVPNGAAEQTGPIVEAPAAPEIVSEGARAVAAPPTAAEPVDDKENRLAAPAIAGEASPAPAVAGETSPATDSAPAPSAGTPAPAQSPSSQPQAADRAALQSPEPAAAPSESAAADSRPEVALPSGPAFDIVRVEPTGEAVIAGSAPANSRVQILSNDEIVAETEANAGGAWVALPDRPLAPGSHDLTIRALSDADESTDSEQRVAVAVPEQPDEQVVAVLDRPGQPSEVLSGPGGEVRAGAQPPQKLDPIATATEFAAGDPQPNAAQAPSLRVDAVEAEGRTVFVAGAGDPGALVRVYVDGELVGEAQAGAGGRWLVQATRTLEEGEVTVRADQVESGTAQVEARAEVPFVRRLDMASLVPVARGGAGAAQSATGDGLPPPNAVIIRRGDNLWTISRRTYGRGVRYTTIYKANEQQIRDPHWIYPGQVFMLPTGDRGWADNQR